MEDLCEFAPLLDRLDEVPTPVLMGVDLVEPWLLGESGVLAETPGNGGVGMELSDEGSSLSDLPDETFGPWWELPEGDQLLERLFPLEPVMSPPSFVPLVALTGEDSDDHHREWSTEAVVVPRTD